MELDQRDQVVLAEGARLALDRWSRRLGAPAAQPGLLALLDRHAARIREALGGRVDAVNLAAYADGVADTAAARGWTLPDGGVIDWRQAPWPAVHLLAVCRLAQ
ncbi:hypothetical protein GCM10010168_36180 [Actinoplanes ianthinogenes]|uniref:Uncharacterized protein n=1 Tax=Actinoplanes ianthinogenes TaxID=122358 RepID=A0ABM7M5F7_9ACTN|nr:DUF6401 family natural product biosynthesis protein [Actinoplanes ianthinogenes]BCJ46860.1 hypothetical protein Aiant_75170 [Actinoplanes ianthinogenes]GGR15011.1 hypothetical protein GCM10010168_36180 [Actinoplanes ianthinogenes]